MHGYPLPELHAKRKVDRGHFIPYTSGGLYGPNLFVQDRALNRGWSEQGKRFRALEREAAATPGTFYYGHLLYEDETAYPTEIESGLLRDTGARPRLEHRPHVAGLQWPPRLDAA